MIRHKGFVPTERDIDLGILQENLKTKAIYLIETLIEKDFDLETFSNPFKQCRTLVAYKYGVKVDLVGISRWKNKRFTATPIRPWTTETYALVHDHKILENYETIELFGYSFNIPTPIEKYLSIEYGSDWKTPKDDHVSKNRVYDFLVSERICESDIDHFNNLALTKNPLLDCIKDYQDDKNLQEIYVETDHYWYLKSPEFEAAFLTPLANQLNKLGGTCLDLGCGVGNISKNLTCNYVGVDASPDAISEGKKHCGNNKTYFICSRLETVSNSDIEQALFPKIKTLLLGNILWLFFKPEKYIEVLEYYRLKFLPEYLVVYDLEPLNCTLLSEKYELIFEHHASVSLDIPDIKNHRKVLIYKCNN